MKNKIHLLSVCFIFIFIIYILIVPYNTRIFIDSSKVNISGIEQNFGIFSTVEIITIGSPCGENNNNRIIINYYQINKTNIVMDNCDSNRIIIINCIWVLLLFINLTLFLVIIYKSIFNHKNAKSGNTRDVLLNSDEKNK